MLDEFSSLANTKGFPFLNSELSMAQHQKMRIFENHLLNDNELSEAVNSDIDDYENSMMRNIYSYCRINRFDKAVFICGSAHRQSLIEKIRYFKGEEKMDVTWVVYGD